MVLETHCLRIDQVGPCYNESYCCLVGVLSCRDPDSPFLRGTFHCKDVMESVLSLNSKVVPR
jgi:hypothetical protein